MPDFSFKITAKDKKTKARAGIIKTSHGIIKTPCFIPAATLGSVRTLDSDDLEKLSIQSVIANTYHLYLKPGDKLIKKFGGLHKFMNFNKPIFTDSGGYQAFSLGLAREHNITKTGVYKKPQINQNLTKISDKGIEFRSIYDGSKHFFTPEKSMEIQSNLGSDLIMAFDECIPSNASKEYSKLSMERTHAWALECIKSHDKKQALYGIIQGGMFQDLRKVSAKFIVSQPFDGIAVGSVLANNKNVVNVLDWVSQFFDERPVHLLGISAVDDIFELVERGVDTFDCVLPTRNARRNHFVYFSSEVGGNIKNKFGFKLRQSKYARDFSPIDKTCACPTCKNHSRAYLHHLLKTKEPSFARLATIHNLHFIINLTKEIRSSIQKGKFLELKRKWLKR